MPRVLNKRTDVIPPNAIYVGRPSKWGNHFRIGEFFGGRALTRNDCVMLYQYFLTSSKAGVALLRDIGELKGKDLVCWCAPLPCHADVLLELANKEVNHGI